MARPNQARLDLRCTAPQCRRGAPAGAARQSDGRGESQCLWPRRGDIAGALQSIVDALAVACIEEAVELRYAGITAPILLLEGVFEAAELETAAQLDLWLTIDNERQLRWLEEATLPTPVNLLAQGGYRHAPPRRGA